MKVDKIIKNAKIFTSDKDHILASALVVKDGKFVYVGDESGLSEYEGETEDLNGKFIMPGIIDSHVHVTMGAGYELVGTFGTIIKCDSKQEALDFIVDDMKKNPGKDRYCYILDKKHLKGKDLTKEDLDAICPDGELQIQEAQMHSIWVNSNILKKHGITDETKDPVPGLSFYVRKDGHITGEMSEGATELPVILDRAMNKSDAEIDAAIQRWIDFCISVGVTAVFDAGIPGYPEFHEHVYSRLRALDEQGKLPIYVDGCYVISAAWEAEEGIRQLKRMQKEYNTEHLKVHTLKLFMDGTLKLHSGAMVTPYADTGELGCTAMNLEETVALLKELNKEGLDFHTHTVGEASSRLVLDAVEQVRKELGDDFRIRVVSAHLQIQDTADLTRFAPLGVIANFTPWWHCDDVEVYKRLFGEERGKKLYRCKSVWDSGALVSWSSDNIVYGDFSTWSPYLGMEVGMTRFISDKTKTMNVERFDYIFPPLDERMGIEEMILGYTINGAKQLGIEKTKGSIEAGKDADYLVFDTDLLTADPDGLSNILPVDVFYSGQKMHYNPFNPDDQSKEESVFKGRPAPYFAMEEMWMKLMEEMWKEFTDEGLD
ncbi:MAG: amidohydrolase [Lachnospiraceae bacterium]|nr:amidohydrolase [Lachnospiraceae bacterium]